MVRVAAILETGRTNDVGRMMSDAPGANGKSVGEAAILGGLGDMFMGDESVRWYGFVRGL